MARARVLLTCATGLSPKIGARGSLLAAGAILANRGRMRGGGPPGGGGGGAGAGAGAGPAQPSNWLQEWRERTPLVTRSAMLLVLPFSLLSLLLGLSVFTANVPALTAGRFQLWRLLTALVDQGQFFTLLFVTLTLATQMPAQEIRAGSLAFLAHLLTTGLLVGALYAVIGLLLGLAGARAQGLEFLVGFGFMPAMGLWPVLLAATTTSVLADPTGSSSFLCFTLPNRVFPLSARARGGAGPGARALAYASA